MTQPSLTVLACQIEIPATTCIAQRDAHLQNSARQVSRALSQSPADLVALPELSSIDYSREAFEQLAQLAEPLDGPSFECWRKVAREFGVTVAYSFPLRQGESNFICMAAVGQDGDLIGHYNKIHLAQYGASMEKEYFSRGGHLFTFKVNGFKVAPIICYDIRIPELCRTLVVDHEVDLILHCGAYYRDESFYTWHAFATARAIENQVFFLSLNRAGRHYGNSLCCWPWMDENNKPLSFAQNKQEFVTLTLDRSSLVEAREKYSFLQDRLSNYDLSTLAPSA